MVNRRLMVGALALAIGCQSNNRAEPPTGSEPTAPEPPRDSEVARDAAGGGIGDAAIADGKPDEPDTVEPSKLIADLGAIPAWQAVIDRAQLLGRRNQRGVVYGRIGGPVAIPLPVGAGSGGSAGSAGSAGSGSASPANSPYVWLIDDTEGNGALGIRVALGSRIAKAGDRVALGGAWLLDDRRQWYWRVDSLHSVPPAEPSDLTDPPWPEPSHVVPNGNLAPGSRIITLAHDNDAVLFQFVGLPPTNEGDGWPVANELGDVPFALLVLPGERASYGGQDMRAADERWQLKRAQVYWVRIGRITKRPDKPALIRARTAPVRVN